MKKIILKFIKVPINNFKRKRNLYRPKLRFPLEIHMADHCNLNCKGCSHYSPISSPRFKTLKDLRDPLKKISSYKIFFKEIRLLGGEPLLNPDLIEIIPLIRLFFPKIRIILVTNGLLLLNDKVCSKEFWEILKKFDIELSITIYPIELNIEKIKEMCSIKGIKYSIYGSRIKKGAFNLFLLNKSKSGDKRNYFHCTESECLQLVDNRIFTCAQSAYVDKLNNKFGTSFKILKQDYLDISKINLLKLLIFLNRPKPFCKYCLFPRPKTNWSLSKMDSKEWIRRMD